VLCRADATQSTHEDKDHIHIVMELCQGGELFDHIVEEQHFTERKVRRARGGHAWQLRLQPDTSC
jgi:hypothetical protein